MTCSDVNIIGSVNCADVGKIYLGVCKDPMMRCDDEQYFCDVWGTAANHAMFGNPKTKAPTCEGVRMNQGVTCNAVGRKLHELCKIQGMRCHEEKYFCTAWGAAVNQANLDASNSTSTPKQGTPPNTTQAAQPKNDASHPSIKPSIREAKTLNIRTPAPNNQAERSTNL